LSQLKNLEKIVIGERGLGGRIGNHRLKPSKFVQPDLKFNFHIYDFGLKCVCSDFTNKGINQYT
jgi:hypothetical protein